MTDTLLLGVVFTAVSESAAPRSDVETDDWWSAASRMSINHV